MRDRVTFVHTADLHLDAPFQGISAASERVGRALAEATYEAFTRVIDTALARRVDFVVIAGDVYNARDKSLRAQLRFREQMNRLAEAGIPVFVAHGNHDPANGWSAGLRMPDTVHVFASDRVERVEVKRQGEVIAAIYGRSFARAAETANLSLGYRRDPADALAIGVLHANVGGDTDYDPYAPATLDDLRSSGMDYWALGHIHKQEVLCEQPRVVYAGSPQGLNPKETGPHGCFVVEVSGAGSIVAEHIETAPVSWSQVALDACATADLDGARTLIAEACRELGAREGRNVIARFTLTGRCAAHADLGRPGTMSALLEEVRVEQATTDPWVWVDRIENRTGAAIDLDAVRQGADFAAEVVRIADELAADPDVLERLLDGFAEPVATTLSGYARSITAADALALARDAALDDLLGGEDR